MAPSAEIFRESRHHALVRRFIEESTVYRLSRSPLLSMPATPIRSQMYSRFLSTAVVHVSQMRNHFREYINRSQ